MGPEPTRIKQISVFKGSLQKNAYYAYLARLSTFNTVVLLFHYEGDSPTICSRPITWIIENKVPFCFYDM